MWPHSVGWHSEYFDILRSAVSKVSSDNDTCPKSHQLQGMASRGKFPLRGMNIRALAFVIHPVLAWM